MFIVKRKTRAAYDAIPVKKADVVYFVAEGSSLANATRYSLYVGEKSVAEEIDLSGYATTDSLESLGTVVEALQGAYIYRGTITTNGDKPTQADLTNEINALLSRAPKMGDVLVTDDTNTDYDKHEWYYNGTMWNNLGQFIISQATINVSGIVKLSNVTTIEQLGGNDVITEKVFKTIVNTQLLKKDIDDYVKTVNGAVGDVIIHGLNILMSGDVGGKQLQSVLQSVYDSASNKVDLPYGSDLDAESYDVGDVIRIRVNAPTAYWADVDSQAWGAFKDNQDNPLSYYTSSEPNPQTFQNNLRNFANSNYPPENLEPYWFIVGGNERNWYLTTQAVYNNGSPKVFEYYEEYIPQSNWLNDIRNNYPINEYPNGAVGRGGDTFTNTYYAVLQYAEEETYYVMTRLPTAEYQYYKVVNVSIPDDRAVSEAIYEAEERIDTIETDKQDKLVAGDNITIDPITNEISVSGQVPLEEHDVIINLQQNKADLINGKVPLEQLPEQRGLVISSTAPTDSKIEMWVKLTGEEIIL